MSRGSGSVYCNRWKHKLTNVLPISTVGRTVKQKRGLEIVASSKDACRRFSLVLANASIASFNVAV